MNDIPFAPPGPMPFRLLLDEALRLARRHFRAIYPAVAIPVALLSTAAAVVQATWFSRMMADLGTQRFPFLNPGYLVMILVQVGGLVIANNALQVAVIAVLSGAPVDMRRAWRFSLQGRVVGTLLLSFLLVLLSMFCCCLPALVVVPLLAFVSPVMADEGRFGVPALSRSVELTRHSPPGRWQEMPLFKVLLLILVGVLLAYLVGILVSLPFQLPLYISAFRRAATGEDVVKGMSSWIWLQVPAQFLNALASEAVYLYTGFGAALLYYDARGRKEGTDLRVEIESMFPPPPPPPGEPSF
jgi:hypothetical protein